MSKGNYVFASDEGINLLLVPEWNFCVAPESQSLRVYYNLNGEYRGL